MHHYHSRSLVLLGLTLVLISLANVVGFMAKGHRQHDSNRYPLVTKVASASGDTSEVPQNLDDDLTLARVVPLVASTDAKTKSGVKEPFVAAKGEVFREENGELSRDDESLDDGEFFDQYTFEAQEGETLVVTLESDDFDTYLLITSELSEDYRWDNDDHQNLTTRSQIEFTVPESGEYSIAVTSYEARETGEYHLVLARLEVRVEEGRLSEGDETLEGGEFIDWYEVEGRPGEMIVIDLTSDDFDTYLILDDPEENRLENDDREDSITHSHIESNLFDEGVHRIGVTSYESGEVGRYELKFSFREGVLFEAVERSSRLSRELEGDETTLADGSFADGYLFRAEEGDTVVISMESEDFDTFLLIRGPAGMDEENDDFEGATDSRIAFRCRKSGRYQLIATSFEPGATGEYRLNLQLEASKYEAGKWAVGENGRVFGVFVGIAEYQDDTLELCDHDARQIYDVFKRQFHMKAEHALLLVNSDATVDEVSRAVRSLVRQTNENDMFVFFYSGHGDQVERSRPDEFDPDGRDETLSLYDGELTDDSLAELLDRGRPGTCLVAIDSCHSGGFAKDIVSQQGRIGLFSSEGDCLSLVADKHGAGGYLSLFFYQALHKDRRVADLNQDQMLTLHELSYYLQEQFEQVVQSGRSGNPSQLYPSGPIDPADDLGYQRILSDRDGISPHLILLDW